MLAGYLAVIGQARGADGPGRPRLRHGQFHDVVLLGDIAYRFPRDEASLRALPTHVALLGALAECSLPVAIPQPVARPDLGQPVGRCHVALRRVDGWALGPREASAPSVLTALGHLLDRLGELGTHPAVSATVPRAGHDYWARFADQVSRVLFPLMPDRGRERAEAELAAVMTLDPTGDALVHGDLGGSNLLWTDADGGPRLAGVIDWDEAHIGSQAGDLASLGATFGWSLAERLAAARPAAARPAGGLATTALADARAIAATFALQQALPAALSGDEAGLADGLAGYRIGA